MFSLCACDGKKVLASLGRVGRHQLGLWHDARLAERACAWLLVRVSWCLRDSVPHPVRVLIVTLLCSTVREVSLTLLFSFCSAKCPYPIGASPQTPAGLSPAPVGDSPQTPPKGLRPSGLPFTMLRIVGACFARKPNL